MEEKIMGQESHEFVADWVPQGNTQEILETGEAIFMALPFN